MTEFERIIKDFLSNAFKETVSTALSKYSHSHNITTSDWNSLVNYCEHLLADVALTVNVLKDISNDGVLVKSRAKDETVPVGSVYAKGSGDSDMVMRTDYYWYGYPAEDYMTLVMRFKDGSILIDTDSENPKRAASVGQVTSAEQAANTYTDKAIALAKQEANTYTDSAKQEANEYADKTKQEAIEYTQSLKLAIDGKYKLTITDANGETLSNAIDLPLEDLIVNIDDVEEDGTRYLQLTLRNGTTTKIELDAIFEGFVKSKASKTNAGRLYGIGPNGEDGAIMMDSAYFKDVSFPGTVVQRMDKGSILLPYPSADEEHAANVGQVNAALENANAYADNVLNTAKAFTSSALEGVATTLGNGIKDAQYRLDRLESASLKYTEFSGVTDAVPVPENAARYAIIEKIGGMTHKVVGDNLWDTKSTVTSREGITVNENGSITLNGKFDGSYASIPIPMTDAPYVCLSLGTNALDSGNGIYLSKYWEESDWLDETSVPIVNGVASWNTAYGAELLIIGTFDDVTICPMLVSGTNPEPYKPYSKILLSTDVTSIRSEEANGTLVDSITIPDAVKDKLPEHFEFGDGVDEENYNYLYTLAETVHGNVARIVLDGSEDAWVVKTNSKTEITRLQISYAALGCPIAWFVDTKTKTPALCNAYESLSASANSNGTKSIAFSSTTFFVYDPMFTLKHFDSEADILGAWKAHLENNPLTVVYKVATPVVKNVSDTIGDAFNRVAVKSLGKVKPVSDSDMAAAMTIAFVESKGVE